MEILSELKRENTHSPLFFIPPVEADNDDAAASCSVKEETIESFGSLEGVLMENGHELIVEIPKVISNLSPDGREVGTATCNLPWDPAYRYGAGGQKIVVSAGA